MTSYINTVPPTITGSRVVGGTLTANPGTWSPTPATFTYQWERADDLNGTNRAPITGATGGTYTLDPLDTTKVVRVGVYPGDPVPAAPPTIAIPGTMIIRYTGSQGTRADMKKNAIVALSPFEITDLGILKGTGPDSSPTTKAIAYQDPTCASNSYPTGGNPTPAQASNPVTLQEAQAWDAAHPTDRWLMYSDAGGLSLVPVGVDHIMNLGSLTYQARTSARITEVMALGAGFNGIEWDNFNSTYGHRLSVGAFPGYVTPPGGGALASLSNAQWKTNITAFISYLRTNNPGVYFMVNAGEQADSTGPATTAWWDVIYPYVDSLECEFFVTLGNDHTMKYNDPSDYHGGFNSSLLMADNAYGHGKDFVGGSSMGVLGGAPFVLSHFEYSRAAFLLKWQGDPFSVTYMENLAANQSYDQDSAYTWIGTPTEVMQGDGLTNSVTGWKRKYQYGYVILNANKPAALGGLSITFNLGGSYYTPTNTSVNSVTLAPVSAMILTTTPHP